MMLYPFFKVVRKVLHRQPISRLDFWKSHPRDTSEVSCLLRGPYLCGGNWAIKDFSSMKSSKSFNFAWHTLHFLGKIDAEKHALVQASFICLQFRSIQPWNMKAKHSRHPEAHRKYFAGCWELNPEQYKIGFDTIWQKYTYIRSPAWWKRMLFVLIHYFLPIYKHTHFCFVFLCIWYGRLIPPSPTRCRVEEVSPAPVLFMSYRGFLQKKNHFHTVKRGLKSLSQSLHFMADDWWRDSFVEPRKHLLEDQCNKSKRSKSSCGGKFWGIDPRIQLRHKSCHRYKTQKKVCSLSHDVHFVNFWRLMMLLRELRTGALPGLKVSKRSFGAKYCRSGTPNICWVESWRVVNLGLLYMGSSWWWFLHSPWYWHILPTPSKDNLIQSGIYIPNPAT